MGKKFHHDLRLVELTDCVRFRTPTTFPHSPQDLHEMAVVYTVATVDTTTQDRGLNQVLESCKVNP